MILACVSSKAYLHYQVFLVKSGILRRKSPNAKENLILIQSICDSNLPKFLEQDISIFNDIIQDLFPKIEVPQREYTILEKQIKIFFN